MPTTLKNCGTFIRMFCAPVVIPFIISSLLASFPVSGFGQACKKGADSPSTTQTQICKKHKANYKLARKWAIERLADYRVSLRVEPNWLEESDLFWYRYKTTDGRNYYLVDPKKKSKKLLFDREKLSSELTRITRDPHNAKDLDLKNLKFIKGTEVIRFEIGNARYEYNRLTGQAAFVDSIIPPTPEAWKNYSPDSSLIVFARGNNLFIMETDDPEGAETQITFDGEKGYNWSSDGEDLIEDDDTTRILVYVDWSKNSRRFAILRYDEREVKELWLVNSLSEPRPTLKTMKYPLPGENIPHSELWVYNHDSGEMVQIDTDRWPDQLLWDLFYSSIYWSDDSNRLFYYRRSRDWFNVDVCAADPETGESRILVEERMNGQVLVRPLVELARTGEYIWWSFRDGRGHFYLYDDKGNVKNQITKGAFNAESVVAIDTLKRFLYFSGNGREEERDPYYRHLYRINFDGSGLRLLTPEDAEHAVVMSESKQYFIDNYSRMDTTPQSVLRDSRGNLILELETADLSRLIAVGFKMPEVFKAKSADGITDQYGVIYKPFDFDPKRKYPIITRVYPGKQGEFVPKAFEPWRTEIYLAQLGFILVQFGNRGGTPERSLWYKEYGRGDLRDYGLADKKVVIEQLADRFDYIDIDRVGMYGGSSGGYMTASAMLVYPDFFKVGVAISGPHDGDIYFHIWHERYQGVKQIVGEDGEVTWESTAPTNIEIAENLKGRILLIHGEMDDNCHPAHSARLADAFIKAGKRFDYFVIPGADHGYRNSWRYLYRLIGDYFVEHLLGDRIESIEMFEED